MATYHIQHLLSPLQVGTMCIKNRVVMMPMGTNMAMPDGGLSEKHLEYYRLRAKGGTGLILVENVAVTYPAGANGATQLRLDRDCYIPRLYDLCETVHAYDSCIGVQLNHAGAAAQSARIGTQPVSSWNLPLRTGGEIPRPLAVEEIYSIVEDYAAAALRAKTAGFDCVEIHAGHSYLPVQFLSPLMNRRTDAFGGSPENRCRFLKLILQAVRKKVGPQYPILIRISADEMLPGGNTLEDTLENLKYFVDEVDLVDVSAGLKDSGDRQIDLGQYPDGWRSYMARAVREKYGKPVITMGNIRDPEIAEDILRRGDADLIGIGRGLIADPNWVKKVSENRQEDIRKCISCNIGCVGHRAGSSTPIRCTINPSLCTEEHHTKRTLLRPCSVVVIGGGMAGLEAACTAAEVGCEVTLFERSSLLGGMTREIALLPEKRRIMDFVNYQVRRAAKLKTLHIHTETDGTMDQIAVCHPDVIVNATGSFPAIPLIKGAERIGADGKVETVMGLIRGLEHYREPAGKRVVIIGGGAVGMDVMEYFALRGADVTVVEMTDRYGTGMDPVSRTGLLRIIREQTVRILTETRLLEIRGNAFLLEQNGISRELPFDYGFICAGLRSDTALLSQLQETFGSTARILNIGNSRHPRQIIDCTAEGRNVLLTLEDLGFL